MMNHFQVARVLIVDDTPMNLRLLSQMLRQADFDVQLAENGAQALQMIRSSLPDIILLDVMMPEMDGFQVCEKLKKNPRTLEIPIIFISALDNPDDKVRAFTVGGVDYITKPFFPEEVLARVKIHLSLRNYQQQLQQANLELQQKVGELQIRNSELDAFAHTVAHDLKNPLTSIFGFVDLIQGRLHNLNAEQIRQSVRRIGISAYKIRDIIDGLLVLAQARDQSVDLEPLDTGRILAGAKERLIGMIEEYQPQIIQPQQWLSAYGYGPWVEEVWTNYLSNAIKYGGRPPHIEVGSRLLSGQEGQNSMVYFFIRDDGPGLTQEEQLRLFTPFTRIHVDRASGHGLGLSIVQRIIERLGGGVGVHSQPGKGSEFYFTLPQADQLADISVSFSR